MKLNALQSNNSIVECDCIKSSEGLAVVWHPEMEVFMVLHIASQQRVLGASSSQEKMIKIMDSMVDAFGDFSDLLNWSAERKQQFDAKRFELYGSILLFESEDDSNDCAFDEYDEISEELDLGNV